MASKKEDNSSCCTYARTGAITICAPCAKTATSSCIVCACRTSTLGHCLRCGAICGDAITLWASAPYAARPSCGIFISICHYVTSSIRTSTNNGFRASRSDRDRSSGSSGSCARAIGSGSNDY
jgi:hypothetical protein